MVNDGDEGEFFDALKRAIKLDFAAIHDARVVDVGYRVSWWFSVSAKAADAAPIRVCVARDRKSVQVSASVFIGHIEVVAIGPVVTSADTIIGDLIGRLIAHCRRGLGAMNPNIDLMHQILNAANTNSPLYAAMLAAIHGPDGYFDRRQKEAKAADAARAASRVTDGAVAVGFSASDTVAPPHRRVPIRYADLEGDGLKHDRTGPHSGRLIKATPIHMGLARPSLLAAALCAGVAAPPKPKATALDADGGRELPPPVGFESPAELRRLGGRPLVTCDDGPTAGWGTYDDD